MHMYVYLCTIFMKRGPGPGPLFMNIMHKYAYMCMNMHNLCMKLCKNGLQIKDMGKASFRKLRNVFLNIFYRMVLLKTPLNDVFCMEMPISRKKTLFYI